MLMRESLSQLPAQLPVEIPLAGVPSFLPAMVVRYLPNRRAVIKGIWSDREVYAKFFYDKHAARYAARDRGGVEALSAAGIDTPQLLHAGLNADGSCEVLLFAEVPHSLNAETAWQGLDDAGRLTLAKALVREVARHHNAGLMQADLYLKNFLLQDSKLYTLDGDGIRKLPSLCTARVAWRNLALLLSKFDVCDEALWLPDLLQIYANERGRNPIPLDKLASLVRQQRDRVINRYADEKVFRNCTDVAVAHTWRRYTAQTREGLVEPSWLAALDEVLDSPRHQRLKSGNTCTVGLTTIDGRKIVVKRYNIKNWLHGLGRLWRRSRAAASWANAHRLRMHGIATASPVALLERRFGPLRLTAYFLADFIDAPDIAAWMRDKSVEEAQKSQIVARLAKLMYKLRLLRIAHGDMKATNIYVNAGEPVLIDLDSMKHYRCNTWFERQHARDLRRLLRNWIDRPHIQRLLIEALYQTYGNDPILKKAGI